MESVATAIMASPAGAAGVDILSFDAVGNAGQAHRFEVKDPAGKSYATPIYFHVIGRMADTVNAFYTKQVNEYITRGEMARRRGKKPEPKTAEEMRDENIGGAAIRVVAWEGFRQAEFDRELLTIALRRNPHWIEQIIEESDDLGNFAPTPSQT